MHAVAQAALPDELFLEVYDLLLERFYNRALYMSLLDLLLASLLKILDVLLLPQTVSIRGHAIFGEDLCALFVRFRRRGVDLGRSESFSSTLARRGGIWTSGAEILWTAGSTGPRYVDRIDVG